MCLNHAFWTFSVLMQQQGALAKDDIDRAEVPESSVTAKLIGRHQHHTATTITACLTNLSMLVPSNLQTRTNQVSEPVVQVKPLLWLVSGCAPAGFGPSAPGTLPNLHSLPQSCDSAAVALCTVLKKKMEGESTQMLCSCYLSATSLLLCVINWYWA